MNIFKTLAEKFKSVGKSKDCDDGEYKGNNQLVQNILEFATISRHFRLVWGDDIPNKDVEDAKYFFEKALKQIQELKDIPTTNATSPLLDALSVVLYGGINIGRKDAILGIQAILSPFLKNKNNDELDILTNGRDKDGNNLLHLVLEAPTLLQSPQEKLKYAHCVSSKSFAEYHGAIEKVMGSVIYMDNPLAKLINYLSDQKLKQMLSEKNNMGMTPVELLASDIIEVKAYGTSALVGESGIDVFSRLLKLDEREDFFSFKNLVFVEQKDGFKEVFLENGPGVFLWENARKIERRCMQENLSKLDLLKLATIQKLPTFSLANSVKNILQTIPLPPYASMVMG